MKTVQVSEVVGNTLDWLVAKSEGHESRCAWMLEKDGYIAWQNYEQAWGNPIPKYSTDWALCGPIIEREGISLCYAEDNPKGMEWYAYDTIQSPDDDVIFASTPLVAAIRCYVASKLGDTVEVPDEI